MQTLVHHEMVNPQKDPTKSIVWRSVPEELKQQLINIQVNIIGGDLTVMEELQANWDFASTIHRHLGAQAGFFVDTVERLEQAAKGAKGGVFDTINEYTKKFRVIERASIETAKQKFPGRSTCYTHPPTDRGL